MSNITSRTFFPASLRALLTSSSIIKLGPCIRQTLLDIAASYDDSEIHSAANLLNSSLIDLGQYAKLKGSITDTSASLQALVGTVLKKLFTAPSVPAAKWGPPEYVTSLHTEIEAIWAVYISLSCQDSVGLPLTVLQTESPNLLVTLCQANKPVAEGYLVWPHPQFIDAINDEAGKLRRINISPSRSLIKLTRVLTPGYIHSLHAQSIQWISEHGGDMVVTTSTLRTRNSVPPAASSSLEWAFAVPALVVLPLNGDFTFNLSIADEANQHIPFEDELDTDPNDPDPIFDDMDIDEPEIFGIPSEDLSQDNTEFSSVSIFQ
jgi:hypothetical protein